MLKKKAYLIGGAKGVGKSTLLKHLIKKIDLEIINTGSIFIEFQDSGIFDYKMKAKEYIINYVINNSPLILDTHYAGFLKNVSNGFERGLTVEEVNTIAEKVDLELILIESSIEQVYKRRVNDKFKVRNLDYANTEKEILANRLYFQEYCTQLSKPGKIIINNDLFKSERLLYEFIKERENV